MQRNWGDRVSLAAYTSFGTSPLVIKRDYKDVRHAYRHPPLGKKEEERGGGGGGGGWILAVISGGVPLSTSPPEGGRGY